MKFRACKYTPESCECPLAETADLQDKMECNCCRHAMNSGFWSRKFFCDDGKKCILRRFPPYINSQIGLFDRCLVFTGMTGLPEISVEKFKFLLSDILEIPKEYWLEIYDTLQIYLNCFYKYQKDKQVEFNRNDFERLEKYAKADG